MAKEPKNAEPKELTVEQKLTALFQLQTMLSEIDKIKYEKMKEIEAIIISNFPVNTECVYLGRIDNRSSKNESLIKVGHTNNLGNRVIDHRKTYKNFIVIQAFKVINKVEIENAIKTHPRISKQLRQININGLNKTEMIAYDEESFTTEIIINLIKRNTFASGITSLSCPAAYVSVSWFLQIGILTGFGRCLHAQRNTHQQ